MLKLIYLAFTLLSLVVQLSCDGRCPLIIGGDRRGYCPYPVPELAKTGLEAILCSSDRNCPGNLKCCPILQRVTGKIYHICTVPMAELIIPTVTVKEIWTSTETVTIGEVSTTTTALWVGNTQSINTNV